MATTFRTGYSADTAGYGENNPGAGLESTSENPIWVAATVRCLEALLRAMDVLGPESNRLISFFLRECIGYLFELVEYVYN